MSGLAFMGIMDGGVARAQGQRPRRSLGLGERPGGSCRYMGSKPNCRLGRLGRRARLRLNGGKGRIPDLLSPNVGLLAANLP